MITIQHPTKDMEIAGWNTDADWRRLKDKLGSKPTENLWLSAYRKFYRKRIDTRYINPMKAIMKNGNNEGEGFAVVALFCTMIEFLGSCEQGKNFRYLKKGDPALQPHEYSNKTASDYFKFILRKTPFDTLVPTGLIDSFYSDVRCGLLHEARTKGGWLISPDPPNGKLIEPLREGGKIFRNAILPSLETYFLDYKSRLLKDAETQEAFIRKFDFLCVP